MWYVHSKFKPLNVITVSVIGAYFNHCAIECLVILFPSKENIFSKYQQPIKNLYSFMSLHFSWLQGCQKLLKLLLRKNTFFLPVVVYIIGRLLNVVDSVDDNFFDGILISVSDQSRIFDIRRSRSDDSTPPKVAQFIFLFLFFRFYETNFKISIFALIERKVFS